MGSVIDRALGRRDRPEPGDLRGPYWVAFYKGPGEWKDRIARFFGRLQFKVIRASTISVYTHCELLRSPTKPVHGQAYWCISASGRDGGVRMKRITFKADRWDFMPAPWAPDDAWERVEIHDRKPYDFKAMVWSHLFNFNRQDPDKWFCSELVAEALKLEMPHSFSPGQLYRALEDHLDSYESGRMHAAGGTPWDE